MNNFNFSEWHDATCFIPWGVNAVVRDALTLAANEDVKIAYNADYREGHPCLINAVAPMLVAGGGNGIPMKHFGRLVSAFDKVNTYFENVGVNKPAGIMSGLAAEILLQVGDWSRGERAQDSINLIEALSKRAYIEPTDAEIQAYLEAAGMLNANPEKVLTTPYSREELPQDYYIGYHS